MSNGFNYNYAEWKGGAKAREGVVTTTKVEEEPNEGSTLLLQV